MTARASTVIEMDAATVYAEGMLAGLRTACNIIGRKDYGDIPPALHRLVREWRSHVYHNQWLAEQGRPGALSSIPDRSQLMQRFDLFLAGCKVTPDDF